MKWPASLKETMKRNDLLGDWYNIALLLVILGGSRYDYTLDDGI